MNKKSLFKNALAFFVAASAMLLSSCNSSKDVLYFQDLKPGDNVAVSAIPVPVTVKPDDKISIVVNSRDPQLMALFNLPRVNKQLSTPGQSSSGSVNVGGNQDVMGYTVDSQGEIDFPVLGKIKVEGKTREEIGAYIKNELITKNLVKDPVVTVEFMNLCVSVLGEVNSPGRYGIDRDRTTIIDALSMAGDLTINGNRNNVTVLRQDGDVQRVYAIDLTSGRDIYSSPAYYLQQNDVIYVEPNEMRARQSTVNGNTIRSASFWISITSLVMSIVVLATNL